MSDGMPAERCEFTIPDGGRWEARVLEPGLPSPYLAAKVARPLVEFVRLDGPAPRRYATLGTADLPSLDDAALAQLWARAKAS